MVTKPSTRGGVLAPQLDIWEILGQGRILNLALKDFYSKVYQDEKLAIFFDGITIERAIEKQYSFLKSILTGERCYFGDHPRNAHHWMVISDDLFDYRENLLEQVLISHGLPDEVVRSLRSISEVFRRAIVKTEARPKRIAGRSLPLTGYSSLRLEVGCLCDHCEAEISAGETACYHNRLGTLKCNKCKEI